MGSLEFIKQKIKKLYEEGAEIHITVRPSRSRITVENEAATLKSIYPRFFCVEECSSGRPKVHSIQYAEVLTGQVQIAELNLIYK